MSLWDRLLGWGHITSGMQTDDRQDDLPPETAGVLDNAMVEFNEKLMTLNNAWRFNEAVNWQFDQETGVFSVSLPGGRSVVADGHALGSYCPGDRTWEWAWFNPNCVRRARKACLPVKKFGKRHRINYLVEGKFEVPGKDYVSYLTAIGIKLLNAEGAYSGSAGPIEVVIALRNLRWQNT